MHRIPLPLEDDDTGAHLGSATMEVVVAVGDAVAYAIAQVTYLDLEAEFWDAPISPDWEAIEKAVARSAASRAASSAPPAARRGPRGPPRAPVPPTWIISTRSARATRHGAARRRGNRGEADGIGHTGHTDGERPRSRRRPRRRARPQRRDEYVLPLESSRNGVRPRPTPAFDAPSSRVDVRIVLGRVPRPMSMDFSASEVRRPGGVRDGHLSSEGCGRGRTQVRWRAHAVDAHDRSDRVQRFSPSNGRPCAS